MSNFMKFKRCDDNYYFIVIFILIGALIGAWIAAGVIPAMMIVGFKLISVKYFVPSVFVVCAIVGMSIGSAFTIISTIGI